MARKQTSGELPRADKTDSSPDVPKGNWCPTSFIMLFNNVYYHYAAPEGSGCGSQVSTPAARVHTCAACPSCPDPIFIAKDDDESGLVIAITEFIPPRKDKFGSSETSAGRVRVADPTHVFCVDAVAVVDLGKQSEVDFRIFKIETWNSIKGITETISVGQQLKAVPAGTQQVAIARFTDAGTIEITDPKQIFHLAMGERFSVLLKKKATAD